MLNALDNLAGLPRGQSDVVETFSGATASYLSLNICSLSGTHGLIRFLPLPLLECPSKETFHHVQRVQGLCASRERNGASRRFHHGSCVQSHHHIPRK